MLAPGEEKPSATFLHVADGFIHERGRQVLRGATQSSHVCTTGLTLVARERLFLTTHCAINLFPNCIVHDAEIWAAFGDLEDPDLSGCLGADTFFDLNPDGSLSSKSK